MIRQSVLKNRKGMTLIEVIVATVIIVVAAIVLVSGFSAMANLNMHNTDKSKANSDLSNAIAQGSIASANLSADYTQTKLTNAVSLQLGTVTIPIDAQLFATKDGQTKYLVFEYKP
jgi:prepilin-type N-terminal cleavage/methylation domain-containing protein